MTKHTRFRSRDRRRKEVDLSQVEEVVSPQIWNALLDSSAELENIGVSHALIGGLAVGAHGHPRATKDVDFLVSESAFSETSSGILLLAPGVPIGIRGVPVDTLGIDEDEEFLNDALENAIKTPEGVAVVEWPVLVYLKLKAGRMRDRSDIVALLNRGADVSSAADFIAKNAPTLLSRFKSWFDEASLEE